MSDLSLTPQQEAEARELEAKVLAAVSQDVKQMCRLMASKQPHQLLGKTEYQMRDLGHQLTARVIEAGVEQQAKKGLPG